MSQDRSTPDRPSLHVVALDDCHRHHPLSVPPLLIQDVAGDKPEQEVEDPHDCTELCGVAGGPAGVVDGQDDDVKEDTEDVDSQAEEDGILTLRKSNTPDKTAQEHQVVDQRGLAEENTKLEKIKNPKYTCSPHWPRVAQDINRRWPRKRDFSFSFGTSGSSSFISW